MTNSIYTNKSFSDHAHAFEPIAAMNSQGPRAKDISDEEKMIPLEYKENGDVIVRMYAPNATQVRVKSTRLSTWSFDIEMTPVGHGIYEAVLARSLGISGDVNIQFLLDGNEVINPYIQTEFYSSKIINTVEVYDPQTPYLYLRDIPHGSITTEIFWSDAVQQYIRCMVYTPPGYSQNTDTYPVLYIQHGGGENETGWIKNGKLPYIMDSNIADQKCVPFIVVTNNGLLKAPHESEINDFDGIEGILTKDCREFIESRYRVKKDKWNRAIAGLSLGSMQACYIGMRHPELYGSIGSFTYIRCRDKDNTYEGNPHLNCLKDAEQFGKDYRLFFRSIGSVEAHLHEFQEDDALIEQYGVDKLDGYHRILIPNQTHSWNCWRRAFYEFSQLLFR